jgi:ribosomal protein S8
MSQDIVADGLNCIMNARKAKKEKIVLKKHSKFLQQILAIGKLKGYISECRNTNAGVEVTIGKLNMCRAVKPRYVVKAHEIDKYVRRYLPSRSLGIVVVSTSKGIMTHHTATEKGLGGCIIAYFY